VLSLAAGGPWLQVPAATTPEATTGSHLPAPAPPAEPAYWPPEDARELLTVDEPMRRFFATRVDRRNNDSQRLEQIVEALIRPDGLHFTYEFDGIYDAREAFRRRRGSCVSFAFLVTAVAREYGLNVRFQEFDTFQRWNRFDRLIAAVRHTNVRMSTDREVYVVDLRPDFAPPGQDIDARDVVPDARAFAHFYSSAGFFHLLNGDTAGALRLMNLGAACDPKSPIVWSNLGNVYGETGELDRARACYEKSLRLDSSGELALVSLVDLLQRQGGPENQKLADKYERRAQALRLRNPYFHHHLAVQSGEAGDWAAVEQHVRQAIRLKGNEPMFYELLVQALRQLGRQAEAERAEVRLAKLRTELATTWERVAQ
jgi:tetratricopeptide (TPR) repeat protein